MIRLGSAVGLRLVHPRLIRCADFWCSNLINGTGACTDPVQGPTEIDACVQPKGAAMVSSCDVLLALVTRSPLPSSPCSHSQEDMGLSDNDIADITKVG